jgi:UDP-N-acetylmuramoylalanine--D-glutamate ligase
VVQASNSVELIIGLGKTGLSCAEFLNDRLMSFRAIDTRDAAPFDTEISELEYCDKTYCGNPDLNMLLMGEYLENVERIIVSPGIDKKGRFFELVQQQEIEIIGDIELFAQFATAPVIAITGSNGKSTVTQLTTVLLKSAGYRILMGGNIGTPALDLLKHDKPDFYVLELSSFQLETTKSLQPIAGTVLNISADHMDRYVNLAEYTAVKLGLLDKCSNIVINIDEFEEHQIESTAEQFTVSLEIDASSDVRTSMFSRHKNADGSIWVCNKSAQLFNQDELKIAGLHNIGNAMSAIALCEASGVKIESPILRNFLDWPGLKHRCEYVGEKRGVRCYNDSKATNVGAAEAALVGLSETIRGDLILIAGGDGKGADFKPLAKVFSRYLSALVLLGRDADRLLEEAGKGISSVIVEDMKQAVAAAFSYAKLGDAILLSPACASFDMYNNFEQRGDIFVQEVEAFV